MRTIRFTVSLLLGLIFSTSTFAQQPDLTKKTPEEKRRKKKIEVPKVKDDRSTMNEQINPNGTISVTPAPPKKKKMVIVPAAPPGQPQIPVPKKR